MCADANGKMVLIDVYAFHKPSVCKKKNAVSMKSNEIDCMPSPK